MLKSPIKNKHNKIRLNNPLFRSVSINSMNQTQIQEEIAKEEKILNNFLTNYKYMDAETCDKKNYSLEKSIKKEKNNRT